MGKYNKVIVSGIVSNLNYSHEIKGEKMYKGIINIERYSGTVDSIPFILPERIGAEVEVGKEVMFHGEYRSKNYTQDGKSHLMLYVFVTNVEYLTEQELGLPDCNNIILKGTIVKKPVYRVTPLGREVADVMMATKMNFGSAYIPVIAWGRCAKYVETLDVGSKIMIEGRIQSRIYLKDGKEKTAYEVSAMSLEKWEKEIKSDEVCKGA